MTVAAFACPCTGDDSPCKCPPGCECALRIGERVNDLPEDGKKWYISVFSDNPEHDKWFQTDPHLKHLKNQTHYRWYGSRSADYKERYAKSTPRLPCIRLQTADGQVVYNVAADKVPATSRQLSYGLFDAIREYRTHASTGGRCPGPNCPNCRPRPDPVDPEPQPLDESEIPTITPYEDLPAATDEMPPVWHLIVAGIVGVVLAGWKYFQDTMGQ